MNPFRAYTVTKQIFYEIFLAFFQCSLGVLSLVPFLRISGRHDPVRNASDAANNESKTASRFCEISHSRTAGHEIRFWCE